MKPNYLVVGAGKCATSSLCQLLGEHPDVFMSEPKEPNFFSNDEIYARGWGWYESLFEGAEGKTAIGEGSGRYTAREAYPRAAPRIARDLPDAKLIYITRHPLDRLESLWMQKRGQGDPVSGSFNRALKENPNWIASSNYLRQIDAYRDHFPDSRILVLFYEDFRADAGAVLRRCFEFLGVDPNAKTEDAERVRNPSKGKRVDTAALWAIRSIPGYRTLKSALPERLRGGIKERVLRKKTRGRPSWRPEVRQAVVDELSEDTARFLSRYGRSEDFWSLER